MKAGLDNLPEFSAHVLRFNEFNEGKSPILVTYDMFGFHQYYYEQAQGKFIAEHEDMLWHTWLSDCHNSEEFDNIALPGSHSARQYQDSGLDNLGYLATIVAHPELAEYVDNPGILVLLIAHLARAKPLLAKHPGRIDLVKALSGSDLIRNFHINWLKKVRPGSEKPAVVAAKLEASLLQVPACNLSPSGSNYTVKRFKLFAHQKQWTIRGLDFARALLQREELEIDDFGYLMNSFNGDEPEIMARVRKTLMEFGGHEYYLYGLARLRARLLARHDQILTLHFARKFRRIVFQSNSESDFIDLCAHFLSDEDIPPPAVKGNRHVRALDTLEKLRSHARKAENCVWGADVVSKLLQRQIDVYAVEGENRYTISVDRHTFEIRMMEPFGGMMIKPADLGLIAEWFEEATALPR